MFRETPLVAASGAVGAVVLFVAVGAVAAVFGPGTPPDPSGNRLGVALLVLLGGVALSWLLVLARAVHGVVVYADAGERPRGLALAVAVGEGGLALAMLVFASAAATLAAGAEARGEILTLGGSAVVLTGAVLAAASTVRAVVAYASGA